GRGCLSGNLEAPNRIAKVQEASGLSALPVHGERLADGSLHAKAVQSRPENIVVVETIDQRFVEGAFIGHRSVNDTLIQVRSANSPDFAGEHDVVAVVNLGRVVVGRRLLGEGNGVPATVMFDGNVTFLDVDVGGAVFAHRAELDELA